MGNLYSTITNLFITNLQTLNSIAAEKNSTIIFPVPIDFVSQFANSKNNRQQQRASSQASFPSAPQPGSTPTKKEI